MDNKIFPRSYKVYVPLFFLFLVLVFILPRSRSFTYDYKKGNTWMYENLVSQLDFPLLKTSEQLEAEKEKLSLSVIPYYKYTSSVYKTNLSSLNQIDFKDDSFSLKAGVSKIIIDLYKRGILSDMVESESEVLRGNSLVFIEKDAVSKRHLKSDFFSIKEAKSYFGAQLDSVFPNVNTDSISLSLGLANLIEPNLVYDPETTGLIHEEKLSKISPTMGVINAGEVLVSKGDMITSELIQVLDSYKAEYERNLDYDGHAVFQIMANVLLSMIIVFLLLYAIYYANYRVFSEVNKFVYLLMIFGLSAITALLVDRADPTILYLVPFFLFALYLLAFFKKRVVLPVYIISLLPLLIFTHNGVELFIMHLVAGVTAIASFQYFSRGWQQFISALIVFVSIALTYMTFRMIDGVNGFNNYNILLYLFVGSFLSVAGYPLIYLFEKIFMLVSNTRLMELCDTNNKLLRELADKAPGTFQHSLQVMNIADAAARSIGANVELVRAGAMYHDIGKMTNPLCFIENQTPGADSYHKGLSYLESAEDIIKHVTDGMVLADKANLPMAVKRFIVTHHGTTCTEYFYNKYLNEGGDKEKAGSFYYDGQKPTAKEDVILMFSDTVEAASRTLTEYSKDNVAKLVDSIVTSKIVTEQLEDADITLREINILRDVLKEYLVRMHHARVVYPKAKR